MGQISKMPRFALKPDATGTNDMRKRLLMEMARERERETYIRTYICVYIYIYVYVQIK